MHEQADVRPLREVTFGAQDYDGNFHYNMFTPDTLARLLDTAGFCSTQILARARASGNYLEFEICARNGNE
ncbi:hypothetical protein GCM10027093_69910 [Paraburkholderia jirisanensis]